MQETEQRQTLGGGVAAEASVADPAAAPQTTQETGEAAELPRRVFGDARDELGTTVVKRKLKTNDVWHVMRIIGRVSKDARKQIMDSDGNAAQIDVMSLMLTEGVDKAQEEINSWFSSLTGVPAQQIDQDDIGFYMDVLEDLDVVGVDGFLGRAIRWYRKKGFGKRDSGSESTKSSNDTDGPTTR